MKGNTFDNKINNKLKGLSVTPSEAAFDKLQAKMGKKGGEKKAFYMWYGAAASIALLLGFFVLQNNDRNALEGLQAEGNLKSKTESNETNKNEKLADEQKTVDYQESEKKLLSQIEDDTKNRLEENTETTAEQKPEMIKKQSAKPKTKLETPSAESKTEEKQNSVKSFESLEKKTENDSRLAMENKLPATEKEEIKEGNEKAIEIIENEQPSENLALNGGDKPAEKQEPEAQQEDVKIEVIIGGGATQSALAVNTQESGNDKDKVKVKDVWEQFLNFKRGEKVDLEALGIRNERLLAFASRGEE